MSAKWKMVVSTSTSKLVSIPHYTCHMYSKEFSKTLRALHDLTSEPAGEEEEKEHTERLREMTGRLRQLCSQEVSQGREVPNPFKLLQIHLKHTFMGSEQIRG